MARVCLLTDDLKYGKETWGKFAGKRRNVYICSLHSVCSVLLFGWRILTILYG